MSTPHIPRKRFGQHFLRDNIVIDNIVAALNPQTDENLIEIGPGEGVLTKPVLEAVNTLQVVEIDRDLAAALIDKHPDTLTVHQHNALKFPFDDLYQPNRPLRVFGNLPYNISTPLLFHLLSFETKIQDMLFMLQKEVVMRMVAAPNSEDYGRLSVMIQYACQAEKLFDVPGSAFSPPPKVVSSIVRLLPYGDQPRPFPLAKDKKRFAQIVSIAFQQRRKMLRKSLKSIVSDQQFEQAGIDPMRRPETLSITEFVALSNVVS